jgi:hypothetical protein
MSKQHPNNGPSLSKAPPKKQRLSASPSPTRRQAELDQTARDTAKAREFNKDGMAWARKCGLLKKRDE